MPMLGEASFSSKEIILKKSDAVLNPQKIIKISGQSQITLLDKYSNSIKGSKFTMPIMLLVVVYQ
jgi:hypothetical protein